MGGTRDKYIFLLLTFTIEQENTSIFLSDLFILTHVSKWNKVKSSWPRLEAPKGT